MLTIIQTFSKGIASTLWMTEGSKKKQRGVY